MRRGGEGKRVLPWEKFRDIGEVVGARVVQEVRIEGRYDHMGPSVGHGVGGFRDIGEKLALVDGDYLGLVFLSIGYHCA